MPEWSQGPLRMNPVQTNTSCKKICVEPSTTTVTANNFTTDPTTVTATNVITDPTKSTAIKCYY